MKLCPYPFSRIQTKNNQFKTNKQGGFFPCCPSWFSRKYYQIEFEEHLDDIWNGKAAVELRKRMYEGDYSLCNREECKIPLMTVEELENPNNLFLETPILKENLEAIKNKNPIMPLNPSSLHLVGDLRCNLKCKTCRPEVINNTQPSIGAEEEYEYLQKLKDNLEIVKMASSGEVFYSITQRKILKEFSPEKFPKLKRVNLVTNGTLFNEKAYNDLKPGSLYIKDVSVSMDAGSKEYYEKIRGPYWEQLVENLNWISAQRQKGVFEYFTLNFVLLNDNYKDVPNLIELGKKLKVDRILIQKYSFAFDQGYTVGEEQYAQAIHMPEHPNYEHMKSILNHYADDPIVHTLIDLPSFQMKIEHDLNIKKMIVELSNVKDSITDVSNFEAIEDKINSISENLLNKTMSYLISEIYFEISKVALSTDNIMAFERYSKLSHEYDLFKKNQLFSLSAVYISDKIYEYERVGLHEASLQMFDLLNEITNSEIDNPNIYFSASLSSKNLGLIDLQKKYLNNTLQLSPKHYYAHLDNAFLNKAEGSFKAALYIFSSLLEHDEGKKNKEFLINEIEYLKTKI